MSTNEEINNLTETNDNIPQNTNYDLPFQEMDNPMLNMTPIQVSPWGGEFNSCNVIEGLNLSSNMELNSDIQQIINIHHDMVHLLSDHFTTVIDKENDEDIQKHKKIIDDGMKSFTNLFQEFDKQQKKTISLENDFKRILEETNKNIMKLKEFSNFMIQLDSKYDEEEIKQLNRMMIQLSEKIKDNSKCEEMKKEYQKQSYLMKYYFHHFIKSINGANLGSTCSLCLQRQVNTFMEPCGHTACSECIQELKRGGSEYNMNCFLCRKSIHRFHKIFFT